MDIWETILGVLGFATGYYISSKIDNDNGGLALKIVLVILILLLVILFGK